MPPEWSEHEETDQSEAFEDRVVAVFTNVAPNFASLIEHRHILGRRRRNRSTVWLAGNIMHRDLQLNQMFSRSPVPECSDYRSPAHRFYLCGVGTHPGGGVSSVSVHNAARENLYDVRDRKLRIGRKS